MKIIFLAHGRSRQGVALVIVLAFVALLTALVVAYLVKAATDRDLARSGYSSTAADLLAQSALMVIVGDMRQEIVDGSSTTTLRILLFPTPTCSRVGVATRRLQATNRMIPPLILSAVASTPI